MLNRNDRIERNLLTIIRCSSTSRPLYDKSGLLVSDQTNRCDCNRFNCSGCFLPCSSCQSSKCGLECRMYSLTLAFFDFHYSLLCTR